MILAAAQHLLFGRRCYGSSRETVDCPNFRQNSFLIPQSSTGGEAAKHGQTCDPVGVAGKRVAFEMGYAAVHTAWEPSYRYVGSKGVAGANNIQSPGSPLKTS